MRGHDTERTGLETMLQNVTASQANGKQANCVSCMTEIRNESFDAERSLYGLHDALLSEVMFDGPADGESPLKESHNLIVGESVFRLRYPLWHAEGVSISGCSFGEPCRAALWYSNHVLISGSRLIGTKAVRECRDISLTDCEVSSDEFGWMSNGLSLRNVSVRSGYAFLRSSGIVASNLRLSGKYSFQYVTNAILRNSILDTKDAFWHSEGVTVEDSVMRGEYLGWYSRNLTLVRCHIEGTQPFVGCEGLRLVDCEMVGCDLAFEGSDVDATVRGRIDSVRDPKSGRIVADEVGEVVHDTLGGCGAEVVAGGRRIR